MTIQVRGASTLSVGSSPANLTKPSGVTAGDLLLLHVRLQADLTPTVPEGFTLIDGAILTGTPNVRVYSKVAGGSEPSTYAVSWSSNSGRVGMIAIYSDIGADLEVDDLATQSNTPTPLYENPAVTTTVANTLITAFLSLLSTQNLTGVPSGYTKRYDAATSTAIFGMTGPFVGPGDTGALTWTGDGNSTSRAVTIAWREASLAELDASIVPFLRVQAARQSSFGTAETPTVALPVRFEYDDGDVEQVAEWDAGVWTGTEIVECVAQFATFRLSGTLFFELLPLLLAAGFAPMTPSGVGPYDYSGAVAAASPGTPSPYTFWLGGDSGSGGSMVEIADAYLRELILTFDLDTKAVTFDSRWFGRRVDDNDGAGYAPETVTLPDGLTMVQGLLSTVGLQDAGASGGAFDALTDLAGSVMAWTLTVETGLLPLWAADQNALTYCGVEVGNPTATWQPTIRTTADNYALTLTKAQARTYQEAQLSFSGDDRALVWQMTGRWAGKLNAHERVRGEVVMQPKFVAATPATQTTTPHLLSWSVETGWEHP